MNDESVTLREDGNVSDLWSDEQVATAVALIRNGKAIRFSAPRVGDTVFGDTAARCDSLCEVIQRQLFPEATLQVVSWRAELRDDEVVAYVFEIAMP